MTHNLRNIQEMHQNKKQQLRHTDPHVNRTALKKRKRKT